jgi:Cysteine-rich secretory protein family
MTSVPSPRRARWLLLAAFCALCFGFLAPAQAASASGNDASDYVARINSLRTSVGVQPLAVDAQLTGLAQAWAQHMAAVGALSHSNLSSGITEPWLKLGENVGVGPDNPTIWNAFLHSAEHYQNLVDPAFNRVGVGVTFANGSEWTCHKFMELAGSGTAAPPPVITTPRVTHPSTNHTSTPAASAPAPTVAPTTTAPPGPPPPQPGPPPPADSARVAAILAALRQLST